MGSSPGEVTEGALHVATGLPDDRRAVLRPGNPLHGRAEHVLREQDALTPEAHAAAWAVLLPLWPLGAREPSLDGLSVAAAMLSRDGMELRDAGWELCSAFDVIRLREARVGRARPSLERGERLLERAEAEPVGVRLRRALGTHWQPELALPIIVLDGETEPEGVWNPLLELEELGLAVAPGDRYVRRAKELLETRWLDRAGEPSLETRRREGERPTMVATAEPL